MVEAELLSGLIGEIYDAALDPALWKPVLGAIAAFVGGQSAALGYIDETNRKVCDVHTFGCDPHYLQLYLNCYGRYDPSMAMGLLPAGRVTSTTDIVPYEQFVEGRFYREWARPQGWVDAIGVVLEKKPGSFSILSILRNGKSGAVDAESRRRLALLAPHLRRATRVGDLFDRQKAELTALAEVFDSLSSAAFLIDGDGRIVHANAGGEALLAEGGGPIRKAAGRLTGHCAAAERAFRQLFIAAGAGDLTLGAKGISSALTGPDGESYLAHVLPLASGARRLAGRHHQAVAAVFIRPAALSSPSAPELIAKVYQLTPTELRVLLGIVEIGGVPEVAEALDVSETTVKTHLKHLYEKTGGRRQADLVRLFATYAVSPVG
jgi:DNA-binding CsgD family transcriptional regulator/PAS domain-containing protein